LRCFGDRKYQTTTRAERPRNAAPRAATLPEVAGEIA